MVRVRMFGGLAIDQDRGITRVVPRKSLALVALLAVAGENGMGREKVAAYLWPESDSEHSRNALNQTLHQLRRSCIGEAIAGTGELKVIADCLTSDVAEFQTALAGGDLSDAIAIYTGPFLDGVFIRGAPLFEHWVEEQRQRFANQYASTLGILAQRAGIDRDVASAIMWWRRLVAHSPLSSRATLGLMQALADAGDQAAALHLARVHELLVREQLDAPPAPEIRALVDTLRALPKTPAGIPLPLPVQSAPVTSIASPPPADPLRVPELSTRAGAGTHRRRLWHRRSVLMLVPPAALFTLLFAAAIHERFAPNDATAGTNAVVSGPVLVGGFENFTGDSTLDIIGPLVADWITQGLARTGVVTVARHSQELWDTRTHGPRDGPRAWADLGRAAGVRIVIHGSYGRAGDSIRMQAVMADPKSGEVIQAIDPVTAPLADRMSLADQLRQRVTSVMAARMNPDLTHWITDAGQPARFTSYLEYAEGMTAFADSRWEDAKVHFFRSAAEDSSYTLPLLWAVFALSNNGEDGRSDSLVNALNRRRATMAPMDRAIHDYERAGYDNHALFEAARRLVEMAPGSEFQWKLADAAREIGRPHEAIRLLKQLDPEKSWVRSMGYWFLLADLELLVGDYDAAREANRRDAAGGWGMQQLEEEASIAAAAGDAAELRRLLVRMEADPEVTTSHGLVDGRAAWSGARALRARGDSADARQIDEWALAFLDTAALVRQARKDPNAIFFINFHRAGMLYDLGRLAESQLLFEQMDSMTTTHGEIDQHVVARNQRRNVHALGYLADIALRRGDRGAVRRYRERIMASPKTTDGAERYMLGRIAALEGRNEDAVTLLAVLLQTNAVWMKDYRIDPDLEGLRRYRPFTDLLVFRQ